MCPTADGRACASVLRRRRRRFARDVRRRQLDPRATAARARARLEPNFACPTPRPAVLRLRSSAATASSKATRPATTATRPAATAAAPTARRSKPGYTCPSARRPVHDGPVAMCGDGMLDPGERLRRRQHDRRRRLLGHLRGRGRLHVPDAPACACTKIECCGDGVVSLDIGEAVRRRQHDLPATAAPRPASSSRTTSARRPASPACRTVVLRRRQGHRQRDLRRRQRDVGRRLLVDLPGRDRLDLPDAGRAVHRRRRAATASSPATSSATTATPSPTTAAARTCTLEPGFACASSACRRSRSATRRRAATASTRASSSATTATSSRTTAARRPARWSRSAQGGTCTRGVRRRPHVPAASSATTATPRRRRLPPTCTIETGLELHRDDQTPPRHADRSRSSIATCSTTARPTPGTGHPDFKTYGSGPSTTGLVQPTLGADGEPVWTSNSGSLDGAKPSAHRRRRTSAGGTTRRTAPATGTDEPVRQARLPRRGGNRTTLTLSQAARPNVYQFDNSSVLPGRRPGLERRPAETDHDCNGDDAPQLRVHQRAALPVHVPGRRPSRRSTSPATTTCGSSSTATSRSTSAACHGAPAASVTLDAGRTPTPLGLANGGMYSIDLFQAERHTCGSDVHADAERLRTHREHVHARSAATASSRATRSATTACNNGAYGGCMPGCLARAPYCGDATVQNPPETCDDGTNAHDLRRHVQGLRPGLQVRAVLRRRRGLATASSATKAPCNGSGYGHCAAGVHARPALRRRPSRQTPSSATTAINNGATGDRARPTARSSAATA